jgi:hypothetical protein
MRPGPRFASARDAVDMYAAKFGGVGVGINPTVALEQQLLIMIGNLV